MTTPDGAPADHLDAIVVGAGMGGLYAVKRLRDDGLEVLGIEAAPDVGGVWFHNGYPGARVDVESLFYCYMFDPELYREWTWSERLATQGELLAYFRHVAERYDLRRSFVFGERVIGAVWRPGPGVWEVTTDAGRAVSARYLVMATGQLSRPRPPSFAGLEDFRGRWVQTGSWEPVPLDGRVAVLGTGSSGVQAVTAIATQASRLFVLQRTPGYVIPVRNGPLDPGEHEAMASSLPETWSRMLASGSGLGTPKPAGRVSDFSPAEQQRILEERWAFRPFDILFAFSDTALDAEANEVVAEFVRRKTAEAIADPALEATLIQRGYPFGARRVVFASGYYESFRRDNVTLVDVAEDPIERFVPEGVRLRSGRVLEIDTMVFATGFDAFTGAISAAGIRNAEGAGPTDHWTRRPETLLGLMSRGFPNLFMPTGPGSPSTLSSNFNLSNVHIVDFIADLIRHAGSRGRSRIEPSAAAVTAWSDHVQDVAQSHLRFRDDNYMVQRNADGSRAMIPYVAGIGEYVRRCTEIARNGYEGFELG